MATVQPVKACPGSGRQWQPGMGRPICPVCKRGIKSLTGKQPADPTKFLLERRKVPTHPQVIPKEGEHGTA